MPTPFVAVLFCGDTFDPSRDTVECSGKTLMAALRTTYYQQLVSQFGSEQARQLTAQVRGAMVIPKTQFDELDLDGPTPVTTVAEQCKFFFGERPGQERHVSRRTTSSDSQSHDADRIAQLVEREVKQRRATRA